MHLVLCLCGVSSWAHMRETSHGWHDRLAPQSGVLSQIAMSLGLPQDPISDILARLVAAERLASPKFIFPPAEILLQTPEGGGIWCLELHKMTNLVFAGCWVSSVSYDCTQKDITNPLHLTLGNTGACPPN